MVIISTLFSCFAELEPLTRISDGIIVGFIISLLFEDNGVLLVSFVLQDSAEGHAPESDNPSTGTAHPYSFSDADQAVDPITKAIRKQILTKQREIIATTLENSSLRSVSVLFY
jgi:hypothetical protein